MYKKFFMGIAAMAALTLVSCSSDDLDSFSDNSSKNEAISFDGYLGRSAVAVNGSRGSVLDKTALQNSTEGFGVFGNYSSTEDKKFGANLFNNQAVTYSSTSGTEQKNGHILLLSIGQHKAILISWRMLLIMQERLKIHIVLNLQYHQQLLSRKICCGLKLLVRQRILSLVQKIK